MKLKILAPLALVTVLTACVTAGPRSSPYTQCDQLNDRVKVLAFVEGVDREKMLEVLQYTTPDKPSIRSEISWADSRLNVTHYINSASEEDFVDWLYYVTHRGFVHPVSKQRAREYIQRCTRY